MEPIAYSSPYFFEEEAQAAAQVVRSKWVVGGPKLLDFERQFAEICQAPHAVGVSSWTTGAFLVLKALGIGPGDEVIVPSLTFIASVNVIVHAGATPVFADIDPHTWNIDPLDVERKITPKTKMIIPVDQIGLPCNIDAIHKIAAKHNLLVLQDAACSFGSLNQGRPIGSLCDITIFSLHARKVVTCGEGGMIVTTNPTLAKQLKRLRHQGMSLTDFERHGSSPTVFETYPEVGYNFRLTDIQAAIGIVQLGRLTEMLEKRQAIAERYQAYFNKHPLFIAPTVPAGIQTNWQSYQVRVKEESPLSRNDWMEELFKRNIPTRRGVMASHLEAPYQHFNSQLPVTEAVAASTLQLPIHPGLSFEQQATILSALDKITESVSIPA